MPDLVWSQILNELDFKTIQNLRKVSKSLRGFIDDVKPDSRLLEITVEPKNLEIRYKNSYQEYIVQYQNFEDRAIEDLELILRNQKSTLESFFIGKSSMEFLENLKKKILESRRSRLKVQELIMETHNQEEIMEILPFLDILELRIFDTEENPRTLKIDVISNLEHWSKIKEISIEGCFISNLDLKSFENFQKVSVDLKTIEVKDVMELKRVLLQSPNFEKFTLFYTEFQDLQDFFKILGPSESDFCGHKESWFFEIPNSKDFLKLDHLDFKQSKLIFSRVSNNFL